jgi:hypothetical protein
VDALGNPFSKQLRSVLDVILVLIFLTTSFDTVLNIKISGFSIRICTLLMLLFSVAVFVLNILGVKKIHIKFLGFWSFLIWFAMLVYFVKNSILLSRGLGYIAWLTIFFAFIVSLTSYVHTQIHFERVLVWYIHSFTIIGALAVIQFLLTLAGFNFLIEYYFISGIPRVHGFSYEPSYFSTYLIIPWSFHFLMFFTDYRDFKKKIMNQTALLILSTVLFMSFSRMGILAMVLLVLSQVFMAIKRAVLYYRLTIRHFIFLLLCSSISLVIIVFAFLNYDKFMLFFEGLPFLSKYWHSATIRIDDFINTWKIFVKSPWAGYSLGGIAPAIAEMKGYVHITQDIVKKNEGMCILLEVLAASGIIGFIFFAIFLSKILFSYKLIKRIALRQGKATDSLHIRVHYLFVLSSIFQLLLLCLNQNILRNYVWTHFAIINLSFFVLKYNLQSKLSANES